MKDKKEILTYILEQKALEEYNLKKALRYIEEDIVLRNSGKELEKIIEVKGADIKELKTKFGEMNFSNWLKGKSISREKAIQLCFELNLDIFDAEIFLQKSCGHDGFHLRNYRDIIFYFCLFNELPYETAIKLIDEHTHIDSIHPNQTQNNGNQPLTFMFKQEVADYETEDELRAFLEENKSKFGSFNNTAYKHFKELFDKVKIKETAHHISEKKRHNDTDDLEKYDRDNVSFNDICDLMRMGIPSNQKKGDLTYLQQMLYEDLPNRPTLTDVYNQKADKNGRIKQITRKPLIIIWMMANEEKEFIPRVQIINGILEECGMPKLDSKNPFDWIVLNALESDGIARMEEIIQGIFETVDDTDISGVATLYLLEQGVKVKRFVISKDVFVIGRNRAEVDCCFDSIDDKSISRKHAQIDKRDDGYYITHLSATDGVYTYINDDVRIDSGESRLLESGDVVRVGERVLGFEVV